jgi:outer membrane protein assembly factor BamB
MSAVAATAIIVWVTLTGGPVDSTPLVHDGTVYIGSTSQAYALDAGTGEIRWTTVIGGDVRSSATLSDGLLYIGSGDNGVYALKADTGQIVWVTLTGGPVDSTPLFNGSSVYIGSTRARFGSEDANTYGLDAATGEILWAADIGGDVRSSATLSDGLLYIGSGDNGLYALSADRDDDGVPDGLDLCAGTVPDTIEPGSLRSRHYAWYGGSSFDSGGGDDEPDVTISDTRGCSVEQIISRLHLGKGQLRFGLSLGPLRRWEKLSSGD